MKKYLLNIQGQDYNVQVDDLNADATQAHVVVNGVEYEVAISGAGTIPSAKPQVSAVKNAVTSPVSAAPAAVRPTAAPAAGDSKIVCPLPGTVLEIKVALGDKVTAGQTVVILEAMKMENNINADHDGVVKEIRAQKGASVMEGETLIVIG